MTAELGKASALHFREPAIGCIGDDQQLVDTPGSDGRDDPEFGKMGVDLIDDGGLLPDLSVTSCATMR